MVKVKSFKVRKSKSIALPRIWLEDQGIKDGDKLDVFADAEGRLIIVPAKAKP